jgi:hypothetical protein
MNVFEILSDLILASTPLRIFCRAGRMAQVVMCRPTKHEALSSNCVTHQKKKKKENKYFGINYFLQIRKLIYTERSGKLPMVKKIKI